MPADLPWILLAGFALVAVLYSSVGHAGASGYIAVMTLLAVAPDVVKPTALALNILVASIATVQFARAGHFQWQLFWPFAVAAAPLAWLGGYLALPARLFQVLVGAALLFAAWRFVVEAGPERPTTAPALPVAVGAGGVIGLFAGLTGTGGGIFLTPLLLTLGWAGAKAAAAVSAPFILLNSTAGLLGNVASTQRLPAELPWLLATVAAGGLLGSWLGARRLPARGIRRLLALVLLVAGAKLVLG